jgi:P27 family predicted phage terminase small subunit
VTTDAPAAAPHAPADLTDDVRAVWERVVDQIPGTLRPTDGDVLRCLCEQIVIHDKASALLAKSDVLIRGKDGTPIPNPALKIQREAAQSVRQLGAAIGLIPDDPADDPAHTTTICVLCHGEQHHDEWTAVHTTLGNYRTPLLPAHAVCAAARETAVVASQSAPSTAGATSRPQ